MLAISMNCCLNGLPLKPAISVFDSAHRVTRVLPLKGSEGRANGLSDCTVSMLWYLVH